MKEKRIEYLENAAEEVNVYLRGLEKLELQNLKVFMCLRRQVIQGNALWRHEEFISGHVYFNELIDDMHSRASITFIEQKNPKKADHCVLCMH